MSIPFCTPLPCSRCSDPPRQLGLLLKAVAIMLLSLVLRGTCDGSGEPLFEVESKTLAVAWLTSFLLFSRFDCSNLGQLVLEYFCRIVQDSLIWCAVDGSAEEVRKSVAKLLLPSRFGVDICEANCDASRLSIVQNSNVIIYCGTNVDEGVAVAQMCVEIGCHFVSKMEESASGLRRIKTLHFSAQQAGCAIVPICSRDVTLGELGLVSLKTKYSPGTLLEASLFQPIAQTPVALFWDTVRLASARLDSAYASEVLEKSTTHIKSTSTGTTSPQIPIKISGEVQLPKISLPSADTSNPPVDSDRMRSISSLDDVSDVQVSMLDLPERKLTSSGKLKSKAKSFGDLSQFELHSNTTLPLGASSLPQHRLRPSKSAQNKKNMSRLSLPPIPKPPILPSFKQIIRSSSTASSLAVPTEASVHSVVDTTLKTVPVRLCTAPRSITPFALSTSYSLPEDNHGLHKLETHHMLTTSFSARFFFLFFRFILVLFLVVPLSRKLLALFDGSNAKEANGDSPLDRKARLKYYVKKAPATLPPSSIRKIDPKFDRMSCTIPAHYKKENSKPLVVGGIGTLAAYLASSSHQSTTKLNFVEVRAPKEASKLFADVICLATCAIALATNPEESVPSGVMPPLSAGGKRLKDWLMDEGFEARYVSFGLK